MPLLKPLIGVINLSKKLSNDDVKMMVVACQNQLNEDVAPAWHAEPWFIVFYPDPKTISLRAYPIVIFDSPDGSDVLGYHAEKNGRPYECIFIEPIIANGGAILYNPIRPQTTSISTMLSHKIIEAFIDKHTNKWADGPAIHEGSSYAYEACDPVQGSSYTKQIGTRLISVSNFLLPSWFNVQNPISNPVDFINVAPGPFQPAPHGYMVVRNNQGDVQQVFGKIKLAEWVLALKTHHTGRTSRRLVQLKKKTWWKYLF